MEKVLWYNNQLDIKLYVKWGKLLKKIKFKIYIYILIMIKNDI